MHDKPFKEIPLSISHSGLQCVVADGAFNLIRLSPSS